MECTGDGCPTPSPTIDPYSVLPNPDDWPTPPDWMFTIVYVLIAIMVAAVLITAIAAFVTWRRRTGQTKARRPARWVDLGEVGEVKDRPVASAREEGSAPPRDDAGGPGQVDDAPPGIER